jgi:resuscitation-promoting factor RpfB
VLNSPQSQRVMNSRPASGRRFNPLILLGILIIIMAVAGGVYVLTSRTVSIVVDGARRDLRTQQATVAGLLAELQLPDRPQDRVSLPGSTRIREGLMVTITRAHPVLIDVDGTRRQIWTQAARPQDILKEAAVILGSHDVLQVDGKEPKTDPYVTAPTYIMVMRARSVQLDNDGTVSTIFTVHQTVGEALHDATLSLYLADSVTPDPSTVITEGTTIKIRRSVPITVLVDGRLLMTRTHARTVSAALAEAGVAPLGQDIVLPDGSTSVEPAMRIRVVRVTEEDFIVGQSELSYKQITRHDATLPLDTRHVVQQGTTGIIEDRVHVRREDGVEVSRSAAERVIVQEARDEIVAIGTQPTLKTLNTPSGAIQYWRVLKMRAASYKPSSTGKSADDPLFGITATGAKLKKGIVAVDPHMIPLGTLLYIPSYGMATAADTGGAVQGLVIDLGYGDDDYQEWSGTVDVYLLPPIPPADQIPFLEEAP